MAIGHRERYADPPRQNEERTMARYVLSLHASQVLPERRISEEWLSRALASPERTERDPVDSSLVHTLRAIPEREGRILRVVWNMTCSPPLVVTAFFDRRERRRT